MPKSPRSSKSPKSPKSPKTSKSPKSSKAKKTLKLSKANQELLASAQAFINNDKRSFKKYQQTREELANQMMQRSLPSQHLVTPQAYQSYLTPEDLMAIEILVNLSKQPKGKK